MAQPDHPGTAGTAAARLRRWLALWPGLLLVGVVLAVIGLKLQQIAFFGSDIPRGDPWTGEAEAVLLPYLRGDLAWRDFFAAHNEHRVVFTRLESLLLLMANGQWDGRLELLVNALLHAGASGVMLLALRRVLSPLALLGAALLTGLLFGSTASWENTLGCFQSQFYFLLLFSFVHLAGSLLARPFSAAWWAAQVFGLANLFTMAGGLFSAAALLATAIHQWVFVRRRGTGLVVLAAWNAGLVILGLWLLPGNAGHSGTALPFADRLVALARIASWPFDRPELGWAVQLPLLLFLGWRLARPRQGDPTGFVTALSVLALVHIGVLAWARGGVASRYVDLLALGLIANAVCWWELPAEGRWRLAKVFLGAVWLALVLSGVWAQERVAENGTLREQDARNQARATAIRMYLNTGDRKVLEAAEAVTETDSTVLARLLSTPEIRRVLPTGARPGLRLADADPGRQTGGFRASAVPTLANGTRELAAIGTWTSDGSAKGEFLSDPFQSRFPVLTFWFSGQLAPGETEFALVAPGGARIRPMLDQADARHRWIRLNVLNPGGAVRVQAEDASEHRWMAFSEPVEVTWLAWWAGKLMKLGPLLWRLGAAAFLVAAAAVIWSWLADEPVEA